MTFDLHQLQARKRAFRQALARRDLAEKLALLDALRERTLTLRTARPSAPSDTPHQEVAPPKVTHE